MTNRKSNMGSFKTLVTFVILVLVALTIWSSFRFVPYSFNQITKQLITDLLVSLFVAAVVLERAMEIFITVWRGIACAEIEARIAEAEEREAEAKQKNNKQAQGQAFNDRLTAQTELEEYKAKTRKIAFISGLSAGIVISIIGVRVLHPLMNPGVQLQEGQQAFFNFVDIILTGGLIGGGSEGIHQIFSVIIDFLDKTRTKIKQSENK